MHVIFSPKRFAMMLRADSIGAFHSIVVVSGFVSALLFLSALVAGRSVPSWNFYSLFWGTFLFIGGYLFTASSFKALHQPISAGFYLTIPASVEEKFLSKLVLTAFCYPLFLLLYIYIFSYLNKFALLLLYRTTITTFEPFTEDVWNSIRLYVATQSFFLVGALFFRKHQFIKTVLVIIFIGIATVIAISFLGVSLTNGDFSAWVELRNGKVYVGGKEISEMFSHLFAVIFWVVLPLGLWIVSYLTLKRFEK